MTYDEKQHPLRGYPLASLGMTKGCHPEERSDEGSAFHPIDAKSELLIDNSR